MPFQPGDRFVVSADSSFSDVSVASNGSFVTVWISNGQVYARTFSAAGEPLGTEDILVSDRDGIESASISTAANGNFVVAFANAAGSFVERFTAVGVRVGNEIELEPIFTEVNRPDVAMFDDGSFVVVSQDIEGEQEFIQLASYDANGVFKATAVIDEAEAGTYYNFDPSIDVVPVAADVLPIAGVTMPSVIVSWRGGIAGSDDIFYARFDDQLNKIGTAFNVTDAPGNQIAPSVAVDAAGNFVIAWQNGENDDANVELRQGSSTGVFFPIKVVDDDADFQGNPAVARANDGRFVVAYEKNGQTFYQSYSATGMAGTAASVAGLTGKDPAVAINGTGNRVVLLGGGEGQALSLSKPTIQFTPALYQIPEGGSATLTLTRTGETALPSQVQLTATGGTATVGLDYTPPATTVSFAPGKTTATVNLATIQDALVESTETVIFNITAGTNTLIGPGTTATLKITNDDIAPLTPIPTPTPSPIPTPTTRPTLGPTPTPANPFVGGNGNDLLVGNAGSNTIVGNGGDDRILGSGGGDDLTGGPGKDQFVFDISQRYSQSVMGTSVITDFLAGEDQIVLDRSTFTKLTGNSLKRSDFDSVKTRREAASSDSLLTYIQRSGALFYNENLDAAGFGEGGRFVDLRDSLSLAAKDFLVVA